MIVKEHWKVERLKQWAAIIEECRASGKKVKQWCAEHNIRTRKYYYWHKKLMDTPLEISDNYDNPGNNLPAVAFAEVPATAISGINPENRITVHYGSVSIDVPEGSDILYIRDLIKTVNELC